MSRIAKKPVKVPSNVKVNVSGQKVLVEGPKGKLEYTSYGGATFMKIAGKE